MAIKYTGGTFPDLKSFIKFSLYDIIGIEKVRENDFSAIASKADIVNILKV